MFNSRPDDHITAVRSRYSAAYQNNFYRLAHLHHLQVLHRHAPIAHVSGHTLILPDASRCRAIANRAYAPMHFRTMCGALSGEVVLFHYALETLAFWTANHIDEVTFLKLRNAQVHLAFGKILLQTKFAHKPLRFGSGLLEFTEQRLGHARFLLHSEPPLHGRITVVVFGQTA